MMQLNARWQFVLLYTGADGGEAASGRGHHGAAVLDGAAGCGDDAGLPMHHFPLERAADAHAAVEDGTVGKVLIDVTE